jgi:hypothetical protein
MATAGVVIASAVVEEEVMSAAVETLVDVLMLPIVKAAHPQHVPAVAAARTVMHPCVIPTPQHRGEERLTVRLIPQRRVGAHLIVPLMPQQGMVAERMLVEGDRTEAVDLMVVANTTRS